MTRAEKAAETRRHNRESAERMAKAREETAAVVATGKCPCCGSKLRRNLALSGWWQCEQHGSDGFRARPSDPECSWQGFVS
jgi:DNA repair exonuclease SbcCD ATPase subunit